MASTRGTRSTASPRSFVEVVTCLGCLTASAGPAVAADWTFDPKVATTAIYDDNYRLTDTPGQEIKVSGGELFAAVDVRLAQPDSTFRITPRIRSTFFPGDSSEEANDQFVDADWERRGQTYRGGLAAAFSRQDLLRGYLPSTALNSGLGDPSRGDSIDRLNGNSTQTLWRLSPRLNFDLSARQGIETQFEYLDASYSNGAQGDYTDYRNLWGGLGWSLKTSTTAGVTLRLTGNWYQPSDADLDKATTYGLQAEWFNRVSEIAQVYARGGFEMTHFDFVSGRGKSKDETSFSGGAGARWNFERSEVFADLSSGVTPDPSGTVLQREELRLQYAQRFAPKVTGYVGARGIYDKKIGSDNAGEKYAKGALGVEWRLNRQWAVAGDYSYTWRKYTDSKTDASANSVRVSLVYEPARPAEGSYIRVGSY